MPDAPLPAAFLDGVRRFNAGDCFEAHEAFEALLDEVEGDERWDLLDGGDAQVTGVPRHRPAPP